MLKGSFGDIALRELLPALESALNLAPRGTDTPAPVPETCGESPPQEGAMVTYTNKLNKGSRAFYQCGPGYKGRSTFIQCKIVKGVLGWSSMQGWPGCTPVDCGAPVPTVNNANPTYTTTTYPSVVTYSCINGLATSDPSPNVTCLDTGVWDTPTFQCDQQAKAAASQIPGGMDLSALSALFNGGGNGGAAPTPSANPGTNQNPMMAALMQALGGAGGAGAAQPSAPAPTGMPAGMAAMMQQMMGGAGNSGGGSSGGMPANMMAMISQMMGGAAPTTTTTTPAPPKQNSFGMPGGFQLPSHLQSLLPNGLPKTANQGVNPRDMMTLASAGLGLSNPNAGGGSLSGFLGAMNPMAAMMGLPGMGAMGGLGAGGGAPGGGPMKGPNGVPLDPEQARERREDMMMQMMMQSAMSNMMRPQPGGNGTQAQQGNPMMDMMMMQMMMGGEGGMGGGKSGGAGGGMNPMSMLGMMNPASLFGSGGGGMGGMPGMMGMGGLGAMMGGGGGGMGGLSALFGGGAKK